MTDTPESYAFTERLKAAIHKRWTLAQTVAYAAPPPWGLGSLVTRHDAIMDSLDQGVIVFAHHYEPAVDVVLFVESYAPDVVIRFCERDVKVMARHRPTAWGPKDYLPEHLEDLRTRLFCSGCRADEWPCPDIRDLAEAYGVEALRVQ